MGLGRAGQVLRATTRSSRIARSAEKVTLGLGRASFLKSLAIPRTTTVLARQLGVSPGTTFEHLSRLRRAGLVESHRSGRSVFYHLSREGEQVLEVFGELD